MNYVQLVTKTNKTSPKQKFSQQKSSKFLKINDIDTKNVNRSELNLSQTKHLNKHCMKGHIYLLE